MEPGTLSTSWSTPEVGYFIPRKYFSRDDEHKHMETGSDLVTRFYNVHAFIAQLRALLMFKQEPVIRANVYFCLRDGALDWYNTELSDAERRHLGAVPLEQGWISMLKRRFKLPCEVALFRTECTDFDIDCNNPEPDPACDLARNMIRHAQALGIDNREEQMKSIWDRISKAPEFSRRITKPTSATSMSELMREIDAADYLRMHQNNPESDMIWEPWFNYKAGRLAAGEEMHEDMKKLIECLKR